MAEEPTGVAPDSPGGGPADGGMPFFGDGEFPGKQGIETAAKQLKRVRDMVMERAGGAFEGVQNALRRLGEGFGGGDSPAVLTDPEVSQQAVDVVIEIWH